MAGKSKPAGEKIEALPTLEGALGFSLSFISGHGLLSMRDKRMGPFEIKILELEIPDIAFPFDVTGGAERFKSRRCTLRHLVYGLDAEGLAAALKRTDLKAAGFHEIRAAIRDGYTEFTGRFAVGEHQADFTFRAALVVRSPEELNIVFFDTRVYGWLPVPSGLLPEYLRRGLDLQFLAGGRAGVWVVRPIEHLLRELLPRNGWKIPDTRHAGLVAAEAARGQIVFVGGPEGEPSPKQIAERAPPPAAIRAGEGIATFGTAEEALGRGNIQLAYQYFREAVDDDRGGRWARERLLQIGASDPELAVETRQLAEETLTEEPQNVQALLALAAIALRERSWGEAANRYSALAEIARTHKDRFDALAADLATADAAKPVDPGAALAAYERAAARARDSLSAHRSLLELRSVQGDWQGAALAGERLARLESDVIRRAEIYSALGHIYRAQLGDLKRARLHFERALRLAPNDPTALEGLAETYAARGEPARAASYLSRLAEQAEEAGETSRIVTLNLRLGEIWERWLADLESATSRYMRVLDVDPKNRTARLRLAKLAEDKGDVTRARTLYEDILAAEEERGDPEAVPDLVAAYTRLARVTFTTDGPTPEAIACLERAVELDPTNRAARDELGKVLQQRGEWSRLLHLLDETIRVSQTPAETRYARLQAATIELKERRDRDAAERYLLQILDLHPDDADALAMLVPLLEAGGDWVEVIDRLSAAAQATTEPERRAAHCLKLSAAHAQLGFDVEVQRRDLESALDANPFHHAAAEGLLALALTQQDPHRISRALQRLATAATSDAARSAALTRRGVLLWRELRQPAEAEPVLYEAVRADAGNSDAWLALADILEARKAGAECGVILNNALATPGLAKAVAGSLHRRLADLAAQADDADAQIQHLTAAIECGLVTDEVCERLVLVLSKRGDRRLAAEHLEAWAAAQSGDAADDMVLRAAEVRRSLGDMDQAATLLRRLFEGAGRRKVEAADLLERVAVERADPKGLTEALTFKVAVAPPDAVLGLLERLVAAQLAASDVSAAEQTCARLLTLEPASPAAHRTMATIQEDRGEWQKAIDHYWQLLIETKRDRQDRNERRKAFERAAALVREIEPALLATLREAFDVEFPEAPPSALDRSLGDLLRAESKWQPLFELRRRQIQTASPQQAVTYRREAAEILHRHLGQSEKAIPYYQDVIAARPNDFQARAALVEVFTGLGRWGDLASLLFAMSQMVAEQADAIDYALHSAEIYADKVGDRATAIQVLNALTGVADTTGNARFAAALRKLGMTAELADYLEAAVAKSPDPEDPQFTELVGLLGGPLNDVARAVLWCERMSEAYPGAERPRRTLIDILKANPKAGSIDKALRAWAQALAGKPRARVLVELAEQVRQTGDERQALAVMAEAVEADPSSEQLLNHLVERYTARGEWDQVRTWLDRLAFATEPGAEREQRLRRLLEVATDYADSAEVAARALRALDHRTPAETRHLAQLFAQLGNIEGLGELGDVFDVLDRDTTLLVAKRLVAQGRLDEARRYLDAGIDKGGALQAWEIATEAWRAAGRLKDLGEWRFARAATASAEDRPLLQLLGRAELLEAGEVVAGAEAELMQELAAANLTNLASAWAVFSVAQSIGSQEWLDKAARSLEARLADSDPRFPRVLRARIDHELGRAHAAAAVPLARRLFEIDAATHEALYEKVLVAADETEALVALLGRRAETDAAAAPALWMQIAAIHIRHHAPARAGEALEHVAADARNTEWAKLALEVGALGPDPAMQAAGAQRMAVLAADPAAKAVWLRRYARIAWQDLKEVHAAKDALTEAQALLPLTTKAVLDEVAELHTHGKDAQAHQVLDEALAVLDGETSGVLWVERGELSLATGDAARALASLSRANEVVGGDAALWQRVGDLAAGLEEAELALKAFARAFEIDHEREQPYLEALKRAAEWDKLAAVLESRADDLAREPGAERLMAAAAIVRTHLDDSARALALMERATKLAPTIDNLRVTFKLAVELDRGSVVAALGPALLKRLPATDAEREAVLHRLVASLERLGLTADARPALEELRARKVATAEETLLLAQLLTDDDPVVAAGLLEDAAQGSRGAERGVRLFAAARARVAAKQTPLAVPLLTQAIADGVDAVEAHRLAVEILPGEARLKSVARLLAQGGDQGLEATVRAELRLELATDRLARGDADSAYTLLAELTQFAKPAAWAPTYEQALRALHKERELAELWLDAAAPSTWRGNDYLSRVREAASIFARLEDVLGELRALQTLGRLLPDDAEVQSRLVEVAAALGDKDQFAAHVRQEMESAKTPEARSGVALRYASVFKDRFEDLEAAAALLEQAYHQAPTAGLAKTLAATLVAAKEPVRAVSVLVEQVERETGVVQLRLLGIAAGIAATDANEAASAYALYHRIFDIDPTQVEAQKFCLAYSLEAEHWEDAIDVLERTAAVSKDPRAVYAELVRAADLARDELKDEKRELHLLEAAVEACPTEAEGVTRLVAKLLKHKDLDGALGLVLGGHVEAESELPMGMELLAALRRQQRSAEADHLLDFLAGRHPESTLGSEARLKNARASGDHATALRELKVQLTHSDALSAEELARLLAEAGRAAHALGDAAAALTYVTNAITTGDTEVASLRLAFELADELADTERLHLVMSRAAARRAEIAEHADGATGIERDHWRFLLARACETAGALDPAIAAYEAVSSDAPAAVLNGVLRGLERLYEKKNDWQKLAMLLNRRAAALEDSPTRAEIYHRMGVIWQHHLIDEERAGDCFALSLRADSSYGPAQLAYGLLLYQRNQFDLALALLSKCLEVADPATSTAELMALADCMRQTQAYDDALTVTAEILRREPKRTEILASRAEMLESLKRPAEAAVEWKRYLMAMGSGAPASQAAQVRRRLASLALAGDDQDAAVRELEEAHQLQSDDIEVIVSLRELYEKTQRWAEAVEMRVREAAIADDAEVRTGHYKTLAAILLTRLNDAPRATTMLERAVESSPNDVGLQRQLLSLHEEHGDWRKFLVVAERLLARTKEDELDAHFFVKLARAYFEAAEDVERATEFYGKALAKSPNDPGIAADFATFAKAHGDFATYVEVEQRAIALAHDVDEQIGRYQEVADVCLHQLKDPQKAAAALYKALAIRPNDPEITRALANTYALDPRSYAQAADMYRALIQLDPLDVQTLRILARLHGQMGENDRAYGYYAALMAITPSDDEAKRFVAACRPAVPPGPQRALADADRVQGLIHPDQSGPIEELFAPLARFAELTHPGNLAALGVTERDVLPATDPRLQWLKRVLEPLGLPQVSIYVRRGGGFACQVELVGAPTIVVGSTLATDASDRQRAFLVARAAELYRTGHALVEQLTVPQLTAVVGALCLAIKPDSSPPGCTEDTPLWANTIAAPMTENIRASLAGKAQGYLDVGGEVDFGRWKWGSVATAGRVAMLLSCDVEEAIAAVLRLRGVDDVTDDQRAAVIRELPEALDLLRFASSEPFFKLRQTLGLALRRSK
ncbi:MAG: tetratricopeptide repeat protein [Deltaproteobacteria bacterium]|nr:tetratricopeptide repeat protein [Deltaproteobacteria bacterium]